MGKSKQAKENKPIKEKKFDRNVEISAPILDPDIIKKIHTPPRGQRLDLKHGGFKALLSDLNSQDSTDELTPLNENHVPSYIGISCAVSGYSNYSSYSKRPNSVSTNRAASTPSRSRATSPAAIYKVDPEVHHITIDKNNIHSADEERKELTEKVIASATERKRSPSPCIPPTEDDRHHGAYVGARYCPLAPPSNLVNKHIPLLGIDDEQNPDEAYEEAEQQKKVEKRIASLYGDNFVDDWRESMTHKAKKEHNNEETTQDQHNIKSPKDLVTLKPTPQPTFDDRTNELEVDIPTPNVKVLAGVEKQFLNRLLTDENPPMPSQSPVQPISPTRNMTNSSSPVSPVMAMNMQQTSEQHLTHSPQPASPTLSPSPQPTQSPTLMNLEAEEQLIGEQEVTLPAQQSGEEHIEYEIRTQSPVDNNASPVKTSHYDESQDIDNLHYESETKQELVSFSPEPPSAQKTVEKDEADENENRLSPSNDNTKDGHYYLDLVDKERSFIIQQVNEAEEILKNQEAELDDDTVGRIRSAIGKANLLINKKFKQFEGLCDSNINKNVDEQFATLNEDLAGFWDMLCIQVSDVQKAFETLWQAKESSWNVGSDVQQDVQQDEGSSLKDNKSVMKPKLSTQKDQERRERLQEHINQMKQNQAAKSSNENLLDEQEPSSESQQTVLEAVSLVEDNSQVLGNNHEEIVAQAPDVAQEESEQMFSLIGGPNVTSLESNVTELKPQTEVTTITAATKNEDSVNDLVCLLD